MLRATVCHLGDVRSDGFPLMLDHLQKALVLLEEQDRRRYFEEMLGVFLAVDLALLPVEDEEQ